MINEIINNDITDVKKQPLAVVDFAATWCGPCKMLAPVFSELSEEMAETVKFYHVDVDENTALSEEYGILSVPSIFVFKNGEPNARLSGFMPKDALKAWIERNS